MSGFVQLIASIWLVLSFSLSANAQIGPATTEVYLSQSQEAVLILGSIEPEIVDIIKSLPESVQWIQLESREGGRLDAALELAQIIENKSYSTFVAHYCYSACTVVYQAGHQRVAEPLAHFMYHKAIWKGEGAEQLAHYQKAMRESYLRNGLKPELVDQITSEAWFLQGRELVSYNAVQVLRSDLEFAWSRGKKLYPHR